MNTSQLSERPGLTQLTIHSGRGPLEAPHAQQGFRAPDMPNVDAVILRPACAVAARSDEGATSDALALRSIAPDPECFDAHPRPLEDNAGEQVGGTTSNIEVPAIQPFYTTEVPDPIGRARRRSRTRRPLPPQDSRDWMTPSETALALGCSVATVHRLRRGLIAGIAPLPFSQYGRKVVFRKASTDRWRDDNERRGLA